MHVPAVVLAVDDAEPHGAVNMSALDSLVIRLREREMGRGGEGGERGGAGKHMEQV